MSTCFYAAVRQRGLHGAVVVPGELVAEIAFETDAEAHKAVAFVFEGLEWCGAAMDADMIAEIQDIAPLAAPPDTDADWTQDGRKLWILRRASG